MFRETTCFELEWTVFFSVAKTIKVTSTVFRAVGVGTAARLKLALTRKELHLPVLLEIVSGIDGDRFF